MLRAFKTLEKDPDIYAPGLRRKLLSHERFA